MTAALLPIAERFIEISRAPTAHCNERTSPISAAASPGRPHSLAGGELLSVPSAWHHPARPASDGHRPTQATSADAVCLPWLQTASLLATPRPPAPSGQTPSMPSRAAA
jgi:hypothetical protein